jgi:hypothetical protein
VVTEYVYAHIPIRMLLLQNMKLIDRDTIIPNIISDIMADAANSGILAKITTEARRTARGLAGAKEAVRNLAREIGGYAILSHTWLIGEPEVIYTDTLSEGWQDAEALRRSKGAGLRKLAQFCSIAREKYKATYGWMDTICIDKSRTSELDESIRSMYRWYLESMVCIVLADTKATPSLHGMDKDRWFTRGWTLQEYLAPKRIRFHDQNWEPLNPDDFNDKLPPVGTYPTLIQQRVEKATGIPPFKSHYSTVNINGGNVMRQMRWAAKRQTTRQEDLAYSLMGIFGVSFAVAYGEGAECAFFRLIEAILASKPADHIFELLAWGGQPVSDEIHTSRLLPSSADCYLDAAQKIPGRRLPPKPMTLTHVGLRARLVLVPMTLVPQSETQFPLNSDDGQRVQFKMHRSNPLHFNPVDVYLVQDYPSYPTPTDVFPSSPITSPSPSSPASESAHSLVQDPRFALAIYTFIEDGEYISIPESGFAFLLGWYPLERISGLGSKDGETASAPLNAHSKINTKRPIQFERKANTRDSATRISKDKRHLQALSIALLTLYL